MNLPDGLNGIQIEMRRRRASVIYGRFDVSGRCQVGGIINRGDAVYCHPPGSPYSEPGSLINISRESSRSLPSPNASLMDDSAHAGRSLIIIMIPSSSKSLGGGGGAAGFFEDVFWGSLRVAPPRGIQPQDEFFFSPTLTCDGGSLEDSHRLLNSNLTGKKKENRDRIAMNTWKIPSWLSCYDPTGTRFSLMDSWTKTREDFKDLRQDPVEDGNEIGFFQDPFRISETVSRIVVRMPLEFHKDLIIIPMWWYLSGFPPPSPPSSRSILLDSFGRKQREGVEEISLRFCQRILVNWFRRSCWDSGVIVPAGLPWPREQVADGWDFPPGDISLNVASIYFQIDSFHNFVSWQEFENGAPTPGGSGDVHHAQLVQLVKRQRSKLDEQQQRLGQLEQELIVSEANLANIQQRDHDQSLQLARQLAHLQEVSHQHDQEVTPSIHPFIRPSVRPSVRPFFSPLRTSATGSFPSPSSCLFSSSYYYYPSS